jgi:hypothetical protein
MAKSRLLGFRDRVSGVRAEAGIVDGVHTRIILQKTSHSSSRRLLAFDAGKQCTQASQRQIRIERRTVYAGKVGPGRKFVQVCPVGGNDDTSDDVGMAIEILCGRVNYKVCAKRDRSLQRRRQKCIVHRRLGADSFSTHGHRADVDDAQLADCWCLDKDQRWLLIERCCIALLRRSDR